MNARFALGSDSLVVELAPTDGYLLRHFVERGVPALGIDPAVTVAKAARARGSRRSSTSSTRGSGGSRSSAAAEPTLVGEQRAGPSATVSWSCAAAGS
jgi:hypothetical protein